jgi:multicomponent Na+:H+ antiporter subunit F
MNPWLASVLIVVLGVALLLTLVRLLRGPTTADRVVALDLLSTLAVGYLAIHAVISGQWIYLDIALGLGLVAFLGTIGFGVLVERQAEEDAKRQAPSGEQPPSGGGVP